METQNWDVERIQFKLWQRTSLKSRVKTYKKDGWSVSLEDPLFFRRGERRRREGQGKEGRRKGIGKE